ncbi:hypothetical protein [Roseibium polysiphoniae]|uniref:Uncharacterized protein n=1 Tax=Roseibium polysiphoniae TaxID=2571221 RepID=A0ABR9CCN5_9HYPH|nr:hypothetical protein [Roseibium polysiphoniae]MBD8877653.1 hypothetical protein [Roseibium polysiphoniae]
MQQSSPKAEPPLDEGYHVTISFCEIDLSEEDIAKIKQYFIDCTRQLIRERDLRAESGKRINTKVRVNSFRPDKA